MHKPATLAAMVRAQLERQRLRGMGGGEGGPDKMMQLQAELASHSGFRLR